MRLGYACLTVGVFDTNFKNIRQKNVNKEKLYQIIEHNLQFLDKMIDYNIANEITLFRITSDLIPFGSSIANQYKWELDFADHFKKIGRKIKKNNIRVSMHPGQYTILNSNRAEVVKAAMADLQYHAKIFDLLQVDSTNKIVLHVGGVYNDKKTAMKRFITNYWKLDENIKKRLVIENDERSFNIIDVLNISAKTNMPVVFDNLHHALNFVDLQIEEIIKKCAATWEKEDGTPKVHYSEQNVLKKQGAHSQTIDCKKLNYFIQRLPTNVDIMLEVKDKNNSVIKCQKYLKI